MTIVYILDTITGDGTEQNQYRPKILDSGLFVAGDNISDSPTEPQYLPDPNLVVIMVTCGQIGMENILASPDYGIGAILYDLPNPYSPDDKPDAAEYGQRRAYAARLGISNAQFRSLFGEPGNPHSRKTGADNLINWVRTLPKGQAK